MSPGEVKARHSSRELTEWMAYFKLEEMDRKQETEKAKLKSQVARRPRRR